MIPEHIADRVEAEIRAAIDAEVPALFRARARLYVPLAKRRALAIIEEAAKEIAADAANV